MANPPAGWYDDPAGDPSLDRLWDGNQWTDQTREKNPSPPSPPPAPPPGPGGPGVHSGEMGFQSGPAGAGGPTAHSGEMPPGPGAPGGPAVHSGPGPGVHSGPGPGPGPGGPGGGLPPAPGGPPGPGPGMAPGPGGAPGPGPGMAPGPGGPGAPGGGVGGIRSDLLDGRYAEKSSNERASLQNSKMLKVILGEPVLARQGSMVAYQGHVEFDHESAGAAKFLKKAVTGEGVSLMRCSGQGELFLADYANDVHVLHLDGAGLTVNGKNILAFESSLSWDIVRVQGAGVGAGGLFNTQLQGHGWVAITTDGTPVVLETNQPTFADAQAAVAWSSNLHTSVKSSIKLKSLVRGGTGEAFQIAFQGQGIVIVQPSEGPQVAVGGGGGAGGVAGALFG